MKFRKKLITVRATKSNKKLKGHSFKYTVHDILLNLNVHKSIDKKTWVITEYSTRYKIYGNGETTKKECIHNFKNKIHTICQNKEYLGDLIKNNQYTP